MLVSLHVKNLALIEECEVYFGKGLNILTGETGAGKSIIIGSINLALGARADKELIRKNADYALIELIFQSSCQTISEKLAAMQLPVEEDGTLIIQRRIMPGRSLSRVNGETVSRSQLRELSAELIDIHGQHEHQSLLHKKKHLEILDEFSGAELTDLKHKLQQAWLYYKEAKDELEKNTLDASTRKREADLAAYEVREIENAFLSEGEDEKLERDYRRMVNARKIAESLGAVYGLTGYENESSAGETVGRALKEIGSAASYDDALTELKSQLVDIDGLLNDFNRSVSEYLNDLSYDQEDFVSTEGRLNIWNHLKDKYGKEYKEIMEYLTASRDRLERLTDHEAHVQNLQNHLSSCRNELEQLSAAADKIRRKNAKILSDKLKDTLKDLNFPKVDFTVEVRRKENFFGADGYNEAEFMISTNPGDTRKPLGNVASGGELSRIMLGLKTIAAGEDKIETLIFDEIDTGISGKTAWKVSEKMAVLGKEHQVICITHLPQIAAMADTHFVIEKNLSLHATVTSIREIDEEELLSELARLLGGETITETAVANARELKELAAKTKQY